MSMSEALRQRRSRWPATRHQEHRVSAAESITAGGADEREYAQDAVLAAQSYVQTGRRFVVDVDLEKFFDRVNHEANVLLDEVDTELQRLGHCFARYADDCNVYVHSRKAGERVMELLRSLHTRLHLTVNEAKSAVASVFGHLEYPDSHDLNFSNRRVRTRMPGGVAAAQSMMTALYADYRKKP